MDNSLLPQHKRLAMGLAVNDVPAGKKMIGDNLAKHAPYGIHKVKGSGDKHPKSGLKSFDGRK